MNQRDFEINLEEAINKLSMLAITWEKESDEHFSKAKEYYKRSPEEWEERALGTVKQDHADSIREVLELLQA